MGQDLDKTFFYLIYWRKVARIAHLEEEAKEILISVSLGMVTALWKWQRAPVLMVRKFRQDSLVTFRKCTGLPSQMWRTPKGILVPL